MQKYLTTLSNSMPDDAFAVMVANKYDLRRSVALTCWSCFFLHLFPTFWTLCS